MKEIVVIFLAMAAGLLCGMGYIAYALLFAVFVGSVFYALTALNYGGNRGTSADRIVKITVPEDLDYYKEIEPVLAEYTSGYELSKIKSVNMGSMLKLTYKATMNDLSRQKEFIDKVRVRNRNLEVAVIREETEEKGL